MGFPGDSDSKESACNAGDLGSIPGWGRSSREGNGNPLQYSCLENSTDRGAWRATVHGVRRSRTWLSDFHFHQIHHHMLLHSLPDTLCFAIQILNYRSLYRTVQKNTQKPNPCRGCTQQYMLDMWTKFRHWTCKHTFTSFESWKLKGPCVGDLL